MAEDSKSNKRVRKQETMREKTAKATKDTKSPRRIKRTASAVKRPVKAVVEAGKKEYHLIPQSDSGVKGFLTKSRRVTPGYFRSSYKELKLVSWPNRKETWRLVFAVFIFATLFGLLITVVDFGLDKLFKQAFL